MNYPKCNCKDEKVIEVEFSVKNLDEKDVWRLCSKCNLKPVFEKFRISEKRLGRLQ